MEVSVKVFKVAKDIFKNQCYLIYKGRQGILVDPAFEYDTINKFLNENELILKGILLTHSHYDHINLAEQFGNDKNVPIYMSNTEIEDYNIFLEGLTKFNHLELIDLGWVKILPILTPGHTTGSACYWIENHLFTGDTVFIEGVGVCHPDETHKLYESIQFLKNILPDDTFFWPGHSFGKTPGKQLKYLLEKNIYFQFKKEKDFVNFRNRKNKPDPFAFK